MWNWPGTAATVLLLVTALVHSWAGERMLIGPLLRRRRDKLLESPLARFVLRFVWHMLSLLLVMLAVILEAAHYAPREELAGICVLVTGLGATAAGLADLIGSRGRHIGWPLILGAGLMALWSWVGLT